MRFADALGLKIVIDASADPGFRCRMSACLLKLRESARGKELYDQVNNHPNTVVIKPSLVGAGTDFPLDTKAIGTGQYISPDLTLHPFSPSGLGPNDRKKYPNEAPPDNGMGCAVVLAHEFGHLLGEDDEARVVQQYENPVRGDFGLPDRTTYRGQPLVFDPNP